MFRIVYIIKNPCIELARTTWMTSDFQAFEGCCTYLVKFGIRFKWVYFLKIEIMFYDFKNVCRRSRFLNNIKSVMPLARSGQRNLMSSLPPPQPPLLKLTTFVFGNKAENGLFCHSAIWLVTFCWLHTIGLYRLTTPLNSVIFIFIIFKLPVSIISTLRCTMGFTPLHFKCSYRSFSYCFA